MTQRDKDNTCRAEIHANAGDTYRPRARCGATLKMGSYASAQSGAATNNPGLVTCPECLHNVATDIVDTPHRPWSRSQYGVG